jgi:virginiamycin B lyase
MHLDYAVQAGAGLTMNLRLLLVVLMTSKALQAQTPATDWNIARPGVKEVQTPIASLKIAAKFKVGRHPDWLLISGDAVWFATSKPNTLQRIDALTNKVISKLSLPGEACSGLVFGFDSVWVPLCGKRPSLLRVNSLTNKIIASLPFGPPSAEAGIAVSRDSVWIVTDENGTLSRVDPQTNRVQQKISIPSGSFNPLFSEDIIWITGVDRNVLTAVDAATGVVLDSIPVGPNPRFLTAGGGSIWTLNQSDGSLTRVDPKSRKVMATITLGIPGPGGDICYSADSVWTSVFGLPLSRIDVKTNKLVRQWVGRGGDSLRFGHDSLWLTDSHHGLVWRIPNDATQSLNF